MGTKWTGQRCKSSTEIHRKTALHSPRRLGQQEDHTSQRHTREQLQTQGQPPLEDGSALSDLTGVDDERSDQGSDSEEELLQSRKLSSSGRVGCRLGQGEQQIKAYTGDQVGARDLPISVW